MEITYYPNSDLEHLAMISLDILVFHYFYVLMKNLSMMLGKK